MQAQRLELKFKELLDEYGASEIAVKEVVEKLMKDTVKAEENRLPGICSLDWEYNQSSIFVDTDTPLVRTFNLLISSIKTCERVLFM